MIRAFVVLAAVALLGISGGSGAFAQTIGFADAIKVLHSSCGADIEKYCKNVNLGNNRIQQCLQKNEANVSDQCKADYAGVYIMLQKRFAAQEAVTKVCDRDIQQLCKLVKKGKGHVLNCLLKAEPSVSDKCNQAITDAGYR